MHRACRQPQPARWRGIVEQRGPSARGAREGAMLALARPRSLEGRRLPPPPLLSSSPFALLPPLPPAPRRLRM
eukprot:4945695-Pyramimonas_sp.AAC.1